MKFMWQPKKQDLVIHRSQQSSLVLRELEALS